MIRFEVVKDFSDNRLLLWDALLAKLENPLPSQNIEWVKCWWESFAPKRMNLFIVLAMEGGEIIGIAPLMYKRNASLKNKILKFIGIGYFDYFDFIIKKNEEKSFLHNFIGYMQSIFGYFELEICGIAEDSATLSAFKSREQAINCGILLYKQIVAPYLKLPQTKEQFCRQVNRSLRADIDRNERRLGEKGKVGFNSCENIREAKEALEDFFSLHIKKWEKAAGYSVYKFNKWRVFLRGLLNCLFEKGAVNIYYLLLNGRKISACFVFKNNKRLLYYSTAYDPEFAVYSPGKLLVNRLIKYLIENKYKEFDFGIGDEYYKTEWTSQKRKIYSIYLYSHKKSLLNTFLKARRHLIQGYSFKILPSLRRVYGVVYFWRFLNRMAGYYIRHQ